MTSIVTYALESVGAVKPPKRVSLTGENGVSLEFDATLREVHAGQSRPTDHPVESGATVSDHVIDQPDTLELQAVVSNNPIIALASLNKEPSIQYGDPNTRAEDAYDAIVFLRKSATLILVSTRLRDYENMLIVSESVTRDKDSSEIIDVTVQLREFRKATIEDADVPEPVEANDRAKTNLGRKKNTPAPAEVDAKSDSIFSGIADATEGLLGG